LYVKKAVLGGFSSGGAPFMLLDEFNGDKGGGLQRVRQYVAIKRA